MLDTCACWIRARARYACMLEMRACTTSASQAGKSLAVFSTHPAGTQRDACAGAGAAPASSRPSDAPPHPPCVAYSVWDLAPGGFHGHVLRPGPGAGGSGDRTAHGGTGGAGPQWVGDNKSDGEQAPRRGQARRDGAHASKSSGAHLRMDGRGAVFLPLLGLFSADQLSVSWRARLACCQPACGTQVLWSMHTLKGWMLRAEVTPDSFGNAPGERAGDGSPGGGGQPGGGGEGASGREVSRKVWAEIILQRHPFQHVLASIGIPVTLLGCDRDGDGGGRKGDNGGGSGEGRGGTRSGSAWISFSLSMSSHRDEPVLFSASVGPKGEHSRAKDEEGRCSEAERLPAGWEEYVDDASGTSGYRNAASGETLQERPCESGRAMPPRVGQVWRSWAADASGGRGFERQPTVSERVARDGRPQVEVGGPGDYHCWFSAALDKTFIHGCAPAEAGDELPVPAVLE